VDKKQLWIVGLITAGAVLGSLLGGAAGYRREALGKAGLAGLAGTLCLGMHFGSVPELGMWAVFAGGLLLLSLTDLDRRVIPNRVLLFLAANRFLWALLLHQPVPAAAGQMFLGLCIPAALLLLAALYKGIRGRTAIGGGDQKLLLVMGLYLSWPQMLLTLLAGCLLGLLVKRGPFHKNWNKETAIPLGPFLSAGAICAICFGDPLIRWYMGFL
jgi:Type II secretory pathway, prepilin signal peptidase PulO and related peptidases